MSVFVRNPHVNGGILITRHSQDRWVERNKSSGSLEDSLKRAMPYGAQRGNAVLLLDGEVAFVVKRKEVDSDWILKTVLTKDQAIVNMEATFGHQKLHVPTTTVVSDIAYVAKRKLKSSEREAGVKVQTLLGMTEEQLREQKEKEVGVWFAVIERLISNRIKMKSLKENCRDKDAYKFRLKQAVTELFGDEQVQRIQDRIEEITRREEVASAHIYNAAITRKEEV